MATCPECDAEIEVDEYDVDKGDLLSCPECGSNLEVVERVSVWSSRRPRTRTTRKTRTTTRTRKRLRTTTRTRRTKKRTTGEDWDQ